MSATVLGDIIERKPGSSASKGSPLSKSTFVDVPSVNGFPKAHHRSQGLSAFAARRAQANQDRSVSSGVPPVRLSISKNTEGSLESKQLVPSEHVAAAGPGKKRTQSEVVTSQSTIQPTEPVARRKEKNDDLEAAWRKSMEQENSFLIDKMDGAQREQERDELVEQLGPDVLDLMSKIQARRAVDSTAPSREHYFLCHYNIY